MNKIKKKPRFKNKKRTKKFRNKNNNPKAIFKYKFIIIVAFLFSFYLMYIIAPISKPYNSTKITNQKLNLTNIKNIFNYSLKYEEFDENINKQYIQLQNY